MTQAAILPSVSDTQEPLPAPELSPLERKILTAVGELAYGAVEIIVHNHRVTEIRQTRRTRVEDLRSQAGHSGSLSG